MKPLKFFTKPLSLAQKQYETLRAFFVENRTASTIAKQFGYTTNSVYSLVNDFKQQLKSGEAQEVYFTQSLVGRKPKENSDEIISLIVALRKKYLSVGDIKSILDAQNKRVSEKYIYNILHQEGFARLPRRDETERHTAMSQVSLVAPKTMALDRMASEQMSTQHAGVLCFLPYLIDLNLEKLVETAGYPSSKSISAVQSILCFVALKLSNIGRYSADDVWCMDRGLGIFAGLNVLPKAAWFSSYSHRVTRQMNLALLKDLHRYWLKQGLLSDTSNLDFVTVPYWGEDSHLENNWSGKRHHALSSILAAVAQDPDSGIITYGDSGVRHDNEKDIVVEFLDFYPAAGKKTPPYLIFDSKFTTYENLSQLDDKGTKFITIRRRGKKILDGIALLPKTDWKNVKVQTTHGKTRTLKVLDQTLFLKGYQKDVRQIVVTGHGKIKPALIITNDFDLNIGHIIRKYAQRALVEKSISEQTYFFHLNKVSSSMVIKVDFDLTMSIFAHNLYRLFAMTMPGYESNTAEKLYQKFIDNSGRVEVTQDNINIKLKKKRNLSLLLTSMKNFEGKKMPWLGDRLFKVDAETYS